MDEKNIQKQGLRNLNLESVTFIKSKKSASKKVKEELQLKANEPNWRKY